MRTAGVLEDARGLGPHDHLCWAYDDPAELRSQVHRFLADGLQQGQRICYLASGDLQTLVEDLRTLDGLDSALRRCAAQVTSLDAVYPLGTVVEPAAQVQVYATATADALAAGFNGLRIAAEATPLVRTPEQLDAFARYEHLVDRYMAEHPFSAMCAYNRGELGDETIAQLACLHPNVNEGTAPFRLHAASRAVAALDGELDLTTAELFGLALDRAELQPIGGEVVIDATGLTFIDHRHLLTLAAHARRATAKVVLRSSWPGLARLVDLLGIPEIRVEPSG